MFNLSLARRGLAAAVMFVAGCGGVAPSGTSDTLAPTLPVGGNAPTPPPSSTPSAPASPATPADPTAPAATPRSHHRCGWIGADTAAAGTKSFVANADFFDAIHPVWYFLTSDGSIRPNALADDATVVDTARAHGVALMPLVYGGDSAAGIRAVIGSPAAIAKNVDALTNLAVTKGYDGLELDYEHLWDASDRPGYVALVTQLAAALHAHGKTLSAAVPALPTDGPNAYDYGAMVAGGLDLIHLMGYDFHYLGGPHLGPLAPLGWLDGVAARVQALGVADRTLMGIANYGVGSGWYDAAGLILPRCTNSTYAAVTTHMTSCPYGNFAAGVAPHCTTAQGEVWFEDATSAAEKARMTAAHGLRGMTYYALGDEPAGYLDALRAVFP